MSVSWLVGKLVSWLVGRLVTLKIRSVDYKRLNTGQSDDPRIFFWVGYEVSHQEKTRGDTILRREVGAMLAQTAPTKAKFLKLTSWLGWFRKGLG